MNTFTRISVGDRFEDNMTFDCYKVVNVNVCYDSWKQEVEVTIDLVKIPNGAYLFDVIVNSIFFLNYKKFTF